MMRGGWMVRGWGWVKRLGGWVPGVLQVMGWGLCTGGVGVAVWLGWDGGGVVGVLLVGVMLFGVGLGFDNRWFGRP